MTRPHFDGTRARILTRPAGCQRAPPPPRSRAAPAPRGGAAGWFERWRGQPGKTNKKPDHVTRFATRSSLQISLCGGRSTFWAIDIQRMVSRTSRSCQEGQNPCTWCNIGPRVWGLHEHGRSCGIWHHWESWLASIPLASIKITHLVQCVS